MPLASANMMPSLSRRARRVSGPSAMRASNRSAVLIWECSGRFDAFVDGAEPRHHQGHESSNRAKEERGRDGV